MSEHENEKWNEWQDRNDKTVKEMQCKKFTHTLKNINRTYRYKKYREVGEMNLQAAKPTKESSKGHPAYACCQHTEAKEVQQKQSECNTKG